MLKDIDDIKMFEAYLHKYENDETGYSIKYLSLEKWFFVVSNGCDLNLMYLKRREKIRTD